MVSILIITHNRSEELLETIKNIKAQTVKDIEIIVVENGSDKEVVQTNEAALKEYGLTYINNNENLGVSGGRNVALKLSKGEIVLEIDDDAVFDDDTAIENVVKFFDEHKEIGIQAFQIINYFSREITPNEYPFKDKKRDSMQSGYSAWFIGAGHAFRRELINDIGYYRDFFPWGSEEQDYAVRAMDAGYKIYYNADIIVFHKKSLKGRINNPTKFAIVALTNRYKFAMYNFPFTNILTHMFVRSAQSVIKFKNPIIPFAAFFRVLKQRQMILGERKVVSKDTRKMLKELKGQLYY